MARNEAGLLKAKERIPAIREEFWKNVSVVGSGEDFNQCLERASRVADLLEFEFAGHRGWRDSIRIAAEETARITAPLSELTGTMVVLFSGTDGSSRYFQPARYAFEANASGKYGAPELVSVAGVCPAEHAASKPSIAIENKNRLTLVLRLAEELANRKATITEFYLAYLYSGTDNIQANLCFLDYTRLKKEEERVHDLTRQMLKVKGDAALAHLDRL